MNAVSRLHVLRVRSRDGRHLPLPDDLEGDPSVVLVAFKNAHSRRSSTCGSRPSNAFATITRGLVVYAVSTIGRRRTPVRGFIHGGMGRSDPGPRDARADAAYTDVGSVVRAFGLSGTDEIAVVQVDRVGMIRWQGIGAYPPGVGEELGSAISGISP